MGRYSDHQIAEYRGNQIEIEGNSLLFSVNFRLIINGQKVDQIEMFVGQASLRALLLLDNEQYQVKVKIKQGIFGTKFRLFLNEQEYRLKKII